MSIRWNETAKCTYIGKLYRLHLYKHIEEKLRNLVHNSWDFNEVTAQLAPCQRFVIKIISDVFWHAITEKCCFMCCNVDLRPLIKCFITSETVSCWRMYLPLLIYDFLLQCCFLFVVFVAGLVRFYRVLYGACSTLYVLWFISRFPLILVDWICGSKKKIP